MALEGRCLCGGVRYRTEGPVAWVLHCHCESCRRATGSAMTTFFSVPVAATTWAGEVSRHASSPGIERGFCPTCGTPLFYAREAKPAEVHLYVATLEDPDALAPEGHDFIEERLGWMHPLPDPQPDRA